MTKFYKAGIRIAAAAVAAVCVISFAGCELGKTENAYTLYRSAAEAIEQANGYEVNCDMNMSFEFLGEEMSTDVDMNIKQSGNVSKIVTYFDGEEIVTTTTEDAVYVEYLDAKTKYSLSDELKESMNAVDSSFSDIPVLTEEMLEGLEIADNGDGTRSIVVELDSDNAAKMLGSFMGEDQSVSFDGVTLRMDFDEDDMLCSMHLDCGIVMNVSGIEITGNETVDYEFVNMGKTPDVSLNYPEEEYTDGGEYVGTVSYGA